MSLDDALALPDAAETDAVVVAPEADDYPTGSLASPTRIRL